MWPSRDNRNSNVIGGPKHFDFDLRIRESKAVELRQMYAKVEAELSESISPWGSEYVWHSPCKDTDKDAFLVITFVL